MYADIHSCRLHVEHVHALHFFVNLQLQRILSICGYACDLTVCGWYVKEITELSIVQHSLYILLVKRFQIPELT